MKTIIHPAITASVKALAQTDLSMTRQLVRAEQASRNEWTGRYCTGKFWHTVRHDHDGEAALFKTQAEAIEAARGAWWEHVRETKQCHGSQRLSPTRPASGVEINSASPRVRKPKPTSRT